MLGSTRGHVLVVDDDPSLCELLELGLRSHGFTVTSRGSGAEALEAVKATDFDAVVTDVAMKAMTGHELCRRMRELAPDLPVIVLTAFGTFESAVEAIRAGAYDFLSKPVTIDAVAVALRRAVERRMLGREVRTLRRAVERAQGFGDLVGASPAMQRTYEVLERVAQSDVTVLVTGESGTGKELVARAVHRAGRRAAGPFVTVDCAAIPETLLESELFGHAKGAFTDARAARAGLFAEADGGTLFLDEIGELPFPLQPKLLRALQQRTVRPLGAGATEVPFDARVVCATNRDLEAAVEAGTFREDLYFRVNVVQIELPPLRSRGGDVLLLAQHFLDRAAERERRAPPELSPEAAEKLAAYPWPGNVRELANCCERALALSRDDRVTVRDLPDRVAEFRPAHVVVSSDDPSELCTLEEMERRYVLRTLDAVGGSKTLAARSLGIDRATLYRKLDRFKEAAPLKGKARS